MATHILNTICISGLSAVNFKKLATQLGHLGLDATLTDKGCNVTGLNLSGTLVHDPSTDTLTVQMHQIPPEVTPGYVLGRLYDEILTLVKS